MTDKKEVINHPAHYNHGKYEAIDVIEDWALGFNLGNAFKYIYRSGHKDTPVLDIEKAIWYLEREKAFRIELHDPKSRRIQMMAKPINNKTISCESLLKEMDFHDDLRRSIISINLINKDTSRNLDLFNMALECLTNYKKRIKK